MPQLRTTLRRHRDFLILTALFASFRWLVLLSYRPGGYILDFSDYYFYRAFAQLTHRGLFPYVNLWTAYPPLFPYLMIGIYRLSALIPDWNGTGVWFYTLLGSVLLLFETGNLTLIYLLGLRLGPRPQAFRAAWFYAGLFVPVYTLTGWFEAMPLFFLLAGLYALACARHHLSALATGLGFMTKLIPIILLPIALRALWARRAGRWRNIATYLLLVILVVLMVALPFLLTSPRLLLSPFQTQAHREPWESIWALWEGKYSYGTVHADMRNVAAPGGSPEPGRVPWTLVSLAFGLAFLFFYTRRIHWREPRAQVAFAGLCVLGLLLYAKGYSPQFAVWVLPFVALLLPNLRGAAYAILLALLNQVEANVYFIIFPQQHQLLAATVLLRTGIFLLLAGEMALILLPRWAERLGTWRRWAAIGAVLATLATALVLAPGLAQAYFQGSLARNPCAEAITHLQREVEPQEAALFVTQDTFDLFYPHLWHQAPCRVLDDYTGREGLVPRVANQVRDLMQDRPGLWLVARDDELRQELGVRATQVLDQDALLVQETKGGACTARYYVSPDSLREPDGPAQLDQIGRVEGALWGLAEDGTELELLLAWRALGPSPQPLTVFTHLLSPDGQVVAGHDGPPAGGAHPTDRWKPGQRIADVHPIPLPPDLPPGRYLLEVGLYQADTGARVPVVNDQGQEISTRVPLGTVDWP